MTNREADDNAGGTGEEDIDESKPAIRCKHGHGVGELACRSLSEESVLFFRRRPRGNPKPRSIRVRCPRCEAEEHDDPVSIIDELTLEYCRDLGFVNPEND